MAADWIKMRTDLYVDPRVLVIADLLLNKESELARYVSHQCRRDMAVTRNVTRNATVGALVTVWGVARKRGTRVRDDLLVECTTISVIDDLADIPGFGAAMEYVGWVQQSDEGVVFPDFFRTYNVDPKEDAAERNAERQRRYRERKRAEQTLERNVTRNVTRNGKRNARVEKSREENKERDTQTRKRVAFVPPAREEVQEYADGNGWLFDAGKFVDFYSAKGWKVGSSSMKDWQAAARNANREGWCSPSNGHPAAPRKSTLDEM